MTSALRCTKDFSGVYRGKTAISKRWDEESRENPKKIINQTNCKLNIKSLSPLLWRIQRNNFGESNKRASVHAKLTLLSKDFQSSMYSQKEWWRLY